MPYSLPGVFISSWLAPWISAQVVQRRLCLFFVPLLATALAPLTLARADQGRAGAPPQVGNIALPFIENRGQYPPEVAFSAATFGGTVFVTTSGEMVYALPKHEGKRVMGE